MRPASLIAFRDELLKIAAVSVDADTRNNMAMRHEVPDFLLEGRLESNDSKETNFFPKLGTKMEKVRDKRDWLQEKYRAARKPGGAALKGGFAGAFLGNMLTGGRLGGENWKTRMGLRGFGALGAGLGLADHYAQKRYKRKKREERAAARAEQAKTAMVGSATFTPGRSLTTGRNTMRFQDKLIHKGDTLRPATMGRKFQIPEG
jgi:hypothetical protein